MFVLVRQLVGVLDVLVVMFLFDVGVEGVNIVVQNLNVIFGIFGVIILFVLRSKVCCFFYICFFFVWFVFLLVKYDCYQYYQLSVISLGLNGYVLVIVSEVML